MFQTRQGKKVRRVKWLLETVTLSDGTQLGIQIGGDVAVLHTEEVSIRIPRQDLEIVRQLLAESREPDDTDYQGGRSTLNLLSEQEVSPDVVLGAMKHSRSLVTRLLTDLDAEIQACEVALDNIDRRHVRQDASVTRSFRHESAWEAVSKLPLLVEHHREATEACARAASTKDGIYNAMSNRDRREGNFSRSFDRAQKAWSHAMEARDNAFDIAAACAGTVALLQSRLEAQRESSRLALSLLLTEPSRH